MRAPQWDRSGGERTASDRVLVFTEHVNATYFISFEIPFAEIARRRSFAWRAVASTSLARHLAAAPLQQLLDALVSDLRPTCVVLTRYALPSGPEILAYFQQRGVRTLYHIDDDLLGLSATLGADVLARHGQDDVVAARRALVRSADQVYASTRALVDVLRRQFPEQQFVSGIYRAYEPAVPATRRNASQVTLGYMGSRGHAEDLELVVPALARLLREQGERIRFELFGTIPFPAGLEAFRSRIAHHKATPDYFEFRRRLSELGWDIGLAPLANHSFNQCKAPTKFIEYTEAGVVTVASDVDVYRQHVASAATGEAALLCKEDAWYESLLRLVADAAQRVDLSRRARDCCAINFPLAGLAAQVERLVAPSVGAGQSGRLSVA
jgi:hypothetical protein